MTPLSGLPVMRTNVAFEGRNKSVFSWALGLLEKEVLGGYWFAVMLSKPDQTPSSSCPHPNEHLFCDEAKRAPRQRLGGSVRHYAGDLTPSFQEQSLFNLLTSPTSCWQNSFSLHKTHWSKVEKERILPEILQLLGVSMGKEDSLVLTLTDVPLASVTKAWQGWEGRGGYCHSCITAGNGILP